ncbi:dTDP-4-dehydrorhamnose reductase [Dongia mobilis]|uniref:dTDP-4-dehydrorhamnose reductase n=1 Tax=Dongia mobilis TaxID=578943 RepID=A0A4R6WLF7_9PROT|nr:sugar nucleotide-binding protein [Dongia mobilis]TDQ81542.1 dTDP-4-dehydrorhamnose reductase [Dongia mobilis]
MRRAKQILIIGRNPALGADLTALRWPAGTEIHSFDGPDVGLLDIERLRRNVEALAPDLIVSIVGSAANERAERDRTLTQARSHWAVGDLAEVAGARNIPLLHLSSDQVFSGDRTTPYLESDAPDAISVFGQAQAAAEAEIRAHCRHHVILRSGWLFGIHGHNMLRTMLSLGKRGGRVHIPHDHVSGPTPARELCSALRQVATVVLDTAASDGAGHTVHFSATPPATLFEFGRVALGHAAAYRVAAELVPISPSRFGAIGAPARRTELDCAIARERFGLVQPDWHEALAACVDEICRTDTIVSEQDLSAALVPMMPRRGALPALLQRDRRRAV